MMRLKHRKLTKYNGTEVLLTKKQEKQLKELVNYVKLNSPKLAELYEGIGENFKLTDLPVTNKQMIMENYDQWITTNDFTLKDLEAFATDTKLAGELYKGKYSICETSGSTGYPFYMAYNRRESSKMVEKMNDTLKKKFVFHRPTCSLLPFDKHILTICTMKHSIRKYPLMKKYLILKDSNIPTEELVEFLNKLQPKILCTYVSTMEMLAKEQIRGNLHLDLKEVIMGGETLSLKTRHYLKEVFGCKLYSLYGSTEASGIAIDCDHGHMHLHNEHLILEAVDDNFQPVPVGMKAQKILITSLYEKTVPLIRYEITDKVTIHDSLCECGNKAPWIEVEGRTVEPPFVFMKNETEINVPTFVLFVKTMGMPNIRKIQLILHQNERLECRIDFIEDRNEKEAFEEIKKILNDSLNGYGVYDVDIYLSDRKPEIDPQTRKFKFAYQIDT